MIDFSYPLAGIDNATEKLDRAASRIAEASFPQGEGEKDSVDLSRELVNLIEARRDFQINANVIRSDNEVYKSVVDLLA